MERNQADIRLPTKALQDDLDFFSQVLKMRLEQIYPADNPRLAILSGHGLRLRLEQDAAEAPGVIHVQSDDADSFAGGARQFKAPNGTRIIIEPRNPRLQIPKSEPAFCVSKLDAQTAWGIGRAGMGYRDLVPARLGGAMIASHIKVGDGPVADMVHFHRVGFQLIFCIRGWVDVLYEDQGGPRRLFAGDCVIQPPEIRHRVLQAGDNLEVVEIGVPAEHVTEIDHEMTLPTPTNRPQRQWDGQSFVHAQAKDGVFDAFRIPGFDARDTLVAAHTQDVASVMVARANGKPAAWTRHDGDILFNFVLSGRLLLEAEDKPASALSAGDAFVIPPGLATLYDQASDDLQLLEVALPATFTTDIIT